MLVRNPFIPGAAILLWESIKGILHSTLRHIGIIYYLKSLCSARSWRTRCSACGGWRSTTEPIRRKTC